MEAVVRLHTVARSGDDRIAHRAERCAQQAGTVRKHAAIDGNLRAADAIFTGVRAAIRAAGDVGPREDGQPGVLF